MAERGPLKRHISKSASDLSDRGRLTDKLDQHERLEIPSPAPAKSAQSVPQLSVAQKTQSFFNTLKIKCFRSRSRERKTKKRSGEDGWAQRDSTDYAADNSSDHSSSATQSPQHRFLFSHQQADSSPLAKTGSHSEQGRNHQSHISAIASETSHQAGIPIPIMPISDEDTRRREVALRQHSFFQLRVHLKRGVNLVARDKGGTSDPYVKFKVGSRLLYKSKTIYRDLNPIWDESFTIPIEDAFVPVHIKVFDYDWGLQDDFMGSAYLDLTKFDLGKATEVKLELLDPGKNEYLGEIFLSATLIPKSQEDKDVTYEKRTKSVRMQGDFSALKKMKNKLSKMGIKGKDGDEDEDEDLPEDCDREVSERKIKQKLLKLREKLGDEIYEDSELAKIKLRQRISKLSEKLKKINREEEELFEDIEDKEKTGAWLKQRIIRLGEKLRRDGDELSEDDDTDKSACGKAKEKKHKKVEKLIKGDIGDEEGKKLCRTMKIKFPRGNTKYCRDSTESEVFHSDGGGESDKSVGKSKVVRFDQASNKREESKDEICDYGGINFCEKLPKCKSDVTETSTTILSNSESVKSEGDRTLLDWTRLKRGKKTKIDKLGKGKDVDDDDCDGGGEEEEEEEQRDGSESADNDSEAKPSRMQTLLVKKLNEANGSDVADELEIVSQSGSEGKTDSIDFQGVEGNLLEKLGQRLKERSDKVQRYFQRTNKLGDVNRRLKSQIWSSVVTIVLVEGKNLQAMDLDGYSDPYIKFRLGNEKYKSKVVYKSLNPSWLEQFDLHLYDDQNQELELTIWDKDRSKDDFMGRCSIDLSQLERETTHSLWQNIEEGSGSIHLLLTISGTTASETISDLTTYEENPRERRNIENRYSLKNTLHNLRDVGHLTVKVYRATGLAAADLGGKSDPFCVLELVNARLQTQTEYKTLSPSWQKIFTFNVKDINSVLEVTVFDEDRDHKVEFLGKVSIPLLRIRNGEKRWYCLKDKKLHVRAKGNCPMILLEMNVVWNPIRAWVRTLNPKEEKYMQGEVKFKRQIFVKNVLRLKAIIMIIIEWGKLIQECFEWERPAQSGVALVLFITLCYYFEPYMILAAILIVFLKHYIVVSLTGERRSSDEDEEPVADDEDDEEDKDKEEKKTLKERLHAIQEVTQTVQNAIGYIASLGEQVKNTFNFTIPFISYLAMGLVIVAMIIVYFIPIRYLIMLFGVNKFARKLLRPHTIPNNEILDLLSRVPDDEELICYREFRPYTSGDADRRRDQRKKQKGS